MKKNKFTSLERVQIEQYLKSKPDTILSQFKSQGITCLIQIDCYANILRDDPEAAKRIRIVAEQYGIPEFHSQ